MFLFRWPPLRPRQTPRGVERSRVEWSGVEGRGGERGEREARGGELSRGGKDQSPMPSLVLLQSRTGFEVLL